MQLAKRAGAHVIATASPRSSERVTSAGADEVIDHTTTAVTAGGGRAGRRAAQPRADRSRGAGGAGRPGSSPAASSSTRSRRSRPPATRAATCAPSASSSAATPQQLSRLTALVDSGELRVDIAQRVPLAELPAVHAKATPASCSARSSSSRTPPDVPGAAQIQQPPHEESSRRSRPRSRVSGRTSVRYFKNKCDRVAPRRPWGPRSAQLRVDLRDLCVRDLELRLVRGARRVAGLANAARVRDTRGVVEGRARRLSYPRMQVSRNLRRAVRPRRMISGSRLLRSPCPKAGARSAASARSSARTP